MRVGSLVVCVDDTGLPPKWKPLVKNKIYTVRDIFNYKFNLGHGILLYEVINTKHEITGHEIGYLPKRFRELDTPTEINLKNILECELV